MDENRARRVVDALRERADIVIDNAGTLADLERRVHEVWALLKRERARRDSRSS